MTVSDSWHTLLENYSFTQHEHFSTKGVCISPLDQQIIFKVTGPDSEKFLQGQLSCDLREVNLDGSRLAAHCNPKGSMLSLMRIARFKNDYYCKVNSENYSDTLINLNKYIMFSKADAVEIKNDWVAFGLFGDSAEAFISKLFEQEAPKENDHALCANDMFVVRVYGQRYELWMQTDKAKWLLQYIHQKPKLTIEADIFLISSKYWQAEEIIQGIADITPQSSAQYIPQMCNLQALQGVSFKKGCYTGQEVITRLHFRGKLNKYLIVAKATTNNVLEEINIGSLAHCSERENIAKVLQLVSIENTTYLQLIVNVKYANHELFFNKNLSIEPMTQAYTLDPNLFLRKD